MTEAEELARRHCATTATDVVNALTAGTLSADELPDELVEALSRENVQPDADPDDRLGWCWGPNGPVAEQG